jgi:uncharacterized protein (TIGR02611 family)
VAGRSSFRKTEDVTASCEFRFYAELNDFLAPESRQRSFVHDFDGTPAVKDRIEALGVPHTEVDLILVDGQSVGFGHLLRGGERVAVYPVFESFEIGDVERLRPRPLRDVRFVLDVNLGRLAGYLRLLGFDSLYRNDFRDEDIVGISRSEHRIILTRDAGLLKRSAVTHGAFVHHTDPREQLREVIERFDLRHRLAPFTRCARCNGTIVAVSRSEAEGRVPDGIWAQDLEFTGCKSCGQVYWHGAHPGRLAGRLAAVGIEFNEPWQDLGVMTGDSGAEAPVDESPKPIRRLERVRDNIRANSSLNLTYRILVGVVGAAVVIIGLALVPYPGPGWLIVFAGLAILSTEFEWAHKLLHWAKARYDDFEAWFKRSPMWVKVLSAVAVTAITVLSLWLLGALALAGGWIGIDWPWLKSPFAS